MAAKLSGSGGGKFNIEANHEINVTPFVDVMLVLLIIFMVAAPLAVPSVKLDLPLAIAKQTKIPPKPAYISIQKDGSLHLGDHPTSLDTLGQDLVNAIGVPDPTHEQRIYIRCDKDTQYGDFMAVMDKLQDAQRYSVALVGLEPKGTHPHG